MVLVVLYIVMVSSGNMLLVARKCLWRTWWLLLSVWYMVNFNFDIRPNCATIIDFRMFTQGQIFTQLHKFTQFSTTVFSENNSSKILNISTIKFLSIVFSVNFLNIYYYKRQNNADSRFIHLLYEICVCRSTNSCNW